MYIYNRIAQKWLIHGPKQHKDNQLQNLHMTVNK